MVCFVFPLIFHSEGIVKMNDGRTFVVSEIEFLQGLCHILSFFTETDPMDLEEDMLYYYHGDLHESQIIFDPINNKWFLVDFGNSRLEFTKTPNDRIYAKETVVLEANPKHSTYDSYEETKKLLQLFLPGKSLIYWLMKIVLPSSKDLIMHLIKTQTQRDICLKKLRRMLETAKQEEENAKFEKGNEESLQ